MLKTTDYTLLNLTKSFLFTGASGFSCPIQEAISDWPLLPHHWPRCFHIRTSAVLCLLLSLLLHTTGLFFKIMNQYRKYKRCKQILTCLFVSFQQMPEDSLFHCRVVYEDSVYASLRNRQEMEENVGIFFDDNYEQISVPVPHFGGSDPADIIHDFQRVSGDNYAILAVFKKIFCL